MNLELRSLIQTALQNRQLAEAEGQLRRALAQYPEDDELYYWMGNVQRLHNNWQAALENYAKATEINPESLAKGAWEMLMQIIQFRDVQRYNV